MLAPRFPPCSRRSPPLLAHPPCLLPPCRTASACSCARSAPSARNRSTPCRHVARMAVRASCSRRSAHGCVAALPA
ncbi:hypothetical protein PF005_g7924 [Phytophthora fragariae]|uniref:SWIM-type domain-containing protein n=1 Tax=Phytophthora fragariae TaxID=53985 RepID=A0A6A3ZTD1_9STRA|nr:hypothetical protein PF003_g23846 [Phytophthora fragariae]KAE8940974.1 hypothetical protein PF009_g9230 [Phytophthora fragariae]KAE9009907.1 hypothetical protein PF011_g10047 [Phytophthora fragariae]KAE9114261.1 hypothetical protein PF007_g10443 [Phytophthora fragariae]KAE9117570.1 hypothetical protein PF010_g8552 [Phytophthora fragariae]